MGKRTAAPRAARMNVEVNNGHVRREPGESRILEPTVTEYDPLKEHQETPPPDDGRAAAASDPNAGRPVATESADDGDKQERIRKLLAVDRDTSEETTETTETTTTEAQPATEQKPATETPKPPTRRDILTNLNAERTKRTMEQQLKTEREGREKAEQRAQELERLAKDGDLLSIAKARGLSTDQAVDLLLNPRAEPAKPTAAAADPVDQRLTRLEQRERAINQREALSVLDDVTKELDIPVVRATSRVAVSDGSGGSTIMSGRDLVMATAQRLWEADGKPAGDRHKYLLEAAPLVEEHLIEDDRERLEAYAAKKNSAPAKPTPAPAAGAKPPGKKPPVPSVGTRSGGTTTQHETPELPEDPDERQRAIKRRMGW